MKISRPTYEYVYKPTQLLNSFIKKKEGKKTTTLYEDLTMYTKDKKKVILHTNWC